MTTFVYDDAAVFISNQQELLDFANERFDNSKWIIGIETPRIHFRPADLMPMEAMELASKLGIDSESLKDTATEGTKMMVRIGKKHYPMRACAIKSLLERAGLQNKAYERLKKMDYRELAKTLNILFRAHIGTSVVKLADNKVSAIHSGRKGAYSVIEIPDILDATVEYLCTEYPKARFEQGYYSHEAVAATWNLSEYADTFFEDCQVLAESEEYEPLVRVVTSDIGTEAVKIQPLLLAGNNVIMLNSVIAVQHKNENSIEDFKNAINMVLDHFKYGLSELEDLTKVKISNGYNALLRIMDAHNFPKAQGLEAAQLFKETYGEGECTAFNIYVGLCSAAHFVQRDCKDDQLKVFRIQDTVQRCMNTSWRKYDLVGDYKW